MAKKCGVCGAFMKEVGTGSNNYEAYICSKCGAEEHISIQPTWEDLGFSQYGPEFD